MSVEGPHLMPMGFSTPLQNSTCALSINLVLSPIHKKCADVLYILPEVESTLVSDCS